jgi:hypothetical protein
MLFGSQANKKAAEIDEKVELQKNKYIFYRVSASKVYLYVQTF